MDFVELRNEFAQRNRALRWQTIYRVATGRERNHLLASQGKTARQVIDVQHVDTLFAAGHGKRFTGSGGFL